MQRGMLFRAFKISAPLVAGKLSFAYRPGSASLRFRRKGRATRAPGRSGSITSEHTLFSTHHQALACMR